MLTLSSNDISHRTIKSGDRSTLLSVQYLRAVAALLVVFSHIVHKQGQITGSGGEWHFGAAGVDLFFVISGFIMCYVTQGKPIGAGQFFKARVLRIIPLYWTLTLAALFVWLINPALVNNSGGVTSIIDSFTLFPGGAKFLIQNGWTLSYEFLFYLIFAASLWLPARYPLAATSIVLFGLVLAGYEWSPAQPALKFLTHPLLLEFVFGIAAYRFLIGGYGKAPVFAAMIVIGTCGLLAFSLLDRPLDRVLSQGLPFALVFTGLVGLEATMRRFSGHLIARWFRYSGDASYALYLSHPFALAACAVVLKRIHVAHALVTIPLMTVCALAAGYACHQWIERPLGKLAAAWFKRPQKRSAPPARSSSL